jgi:hypothetical protein
MSPLKLVSIFILFLVMLGGQTILTVNHADAGCCNIYKPIPGCTRYYAMVFGSAKPLNDEGTAFLIKDDKGFYKEVQASQDFIEQYKKNREDYATDGKNNEKVLNGFSILNTDTETDEVMLIAFVPGTLDHKKHSQGPGAIARRYNKLFEEVAQAPTLHPYKKITNASTTIR